MVVSVRIGSSCGWLIEGMALAYGVMVRDG